MTIFSDEERREKVSALEAALGIKLQFNGECGWCKTKEGTIFYNGKELYGPFSDDPLINIAGAIYTGREDRLYSYREDLAGSCKATILELVVRNAGSEALDGLDIEKIVEFFWNASSRPGKRFAKTNLPNKEKYNQVLAKIFNKEDHLNKGHYNLTIIDFWSE